MGKKYKVIISIDINADSAEIAAKSMIRFLQRKDHLWGEVFEYQDDNSIESRIIFRYPDLLLENGEKA